jgi:hypothetical protein
MESNTISPKAIGLNLPNLVLLRQMPLTVVVAALVLAGLVYVQRSRSKLQLARFPLYLEHLSSEERRAKFLAGAKALYKDGHQKVLYSNKISYSTNTLLVQRIGL